MKIRFTKHAERKFKVLRRHGFQISREDVIQTLRKPEKVSRGWKGRLVASRPINAEHVLRVIYEKRDEDRMVVTFYPARSERYEG